MTFLLINTTTSEPSSGQMENDRYFRAQSGRHCLLMILFSVGKSTHMFYLCKTDWESDRTSEYSLKGLFGRKRSVCLV